jgi:hypothetical protein
MDTKKMNLFILDKKFYTRNSVGVYETVFLLW